MDCLGVSILCVLNQKHHEKCDDRRSGIDDELPRIGKMKGRPCEDPHTNDKHSSRKCPRTAEHHGGTVRENMECVADDTKEIAVLFVLFPFFGLILLHSLTLASHPVRRTRAQDRESTLTFALNSGIDFPGDLRKTWFPT